MNTKKKVLAIVLTIAILITTVSSAIYYVISNSTLLSPNDSSDEVFGKSYTVSNIYDESAAYDNFTFNKDKTFKWTRSDSTLSGSYALYTGNDIARLFNSEKASKGFSRDDIKNVKESVDSLVSSGAANNKDDVVYIKLTHVKTKSENGEVESFDDIVLFGTKTNSGYSLEYMATREYYSFVEKI